MEKRNDRIVLINKLVEKQSTNKCQTCNWYRTAWPFVSTCMNNFVCFALEKLIARLIDSRKKCIQCLFIDSEGAD